MADEKRVKFLVKLFLQKTGTRGTLICQVSSVCVKQALKINFLLFKGTPTRKYSAGSGPRPGFHRQVFSQEASAISKYSFLGD